MYLSDVFVALFHITVSIHRGGQTHTYCRDQTSVYQLVAICVGTYFWPALRKHIKPQCRWFRLTHFIWKSPGKEEEETDNYSGRDNMGQPVKLPGLRVWLYPSGPAPEILLLG